MKVYKFVLNIFATSIFVIMMFSIIVYMTVICTIATCMYFKNTFFPLKKILVYSYRFIRYEKFNLEDTMPLFSEEIPETFNHVKFKEKQYE